MINMARISSPSIGFPGFQKPILRYDRLGQNGSMTPGPSSPGTGVTPSGVPATVPGPSFDRLDPGFPIFPAPIYPPNYLFPVVEDPTIVRTPAAVPTWLIVAGSAAAGVALALLLAKN